MFLTFWAKQYFDCLNHNLLKNHLAYENFDAIFVFLGQFAWI